MKDEIMKFPSELIQKELAKDPAKLLNSLNNVKEIPSKKNNNIEQNTEEEKEKEKNDSQYSINNAMISVHPDEIIVKREDDIYQDNNIALFNCDDLYRYDNENLPEGDPFLKLDSSYDNLNMNVEEFFYFTHK